ncbi:MAG: hypothetical protein RL757_3175 [Bacteroidota bacterium]|jgi:hypothetical protein
MRTEKLNLKKQNAESGLFRIFAAFKSPPQYKITFFFKDDIFFLNVAGFEVNILEKFI